MRVLGRRDNHRVNSFEIVEQSTKVPEPLGFAMLLTDAVEGIAIHITYRSDSHPSGRSHFLKIPAPSATNTHEGEIQDIVGTVSFGKTRRARKPRKHGGLLE